MDPNATLAEMRQLSKKIESGHYSQDDLSRLIDLLESLDNWIVNEGFMPADWANRR